MGFFYPSTSETKFVELSREQLYKNFKTYIKPIKPVDMDGESTGYLFNGIWNEESFSISLKLKIANNFVPLIHASFIDSDEGILLKLDYEFFPSTKKLLLFWTTLTILITLFFVVIHQAWLYGAISLAFCLVNYILSRENFKIQVRKSKRMLDQMLS